MYIYRYIYCQYGYNNFFAKTSCTSTNTEGVILNDGEGAVRDHTLPG